MMKSILSLIVATATLLPTNHAFTIQSRVVSTNRILSISSNNPAAPIIQSTPSSIQHYSSATSTTVLFSSDNKDDSSSSSSSSSSLVESEQTILGITGFIASLIMLYSESVLFQTGCGLPAGPFGVVGAAEGVSYLGVVGLVGYSLFTKITTGSGLPAGPKGILGAAEGVAYLAVLAGILVLIAQVTNYGYIPNAVPMEGGMCT